MGKLLRAFAYLIGGIFLIAIFGLALTPNISAQETAISDAIDSGDVTVQIESTGSATGHVANMVVTANTDVILDLAHSGLEGMVGDNPNQGEQPVVITDTPGISTGPSSYTPADNVTIQSGNSVTIPIIGYCINFDEATPTSGTYFTLVPNSTITYFGPIEDVLTTINNYNWPSGFSTNQIQTTIQLAVWMGQPVNYDVPLEDYGTRGYDVSQSITSNVTEILDQTGIDTQDIVALSGTTKDEPDEDEEEGPGILPWVLLLILLVGVVLAAGVYGKTRERKKGEGTRTRETPEEGTEQVDSAPTSGAVTYHKRRHQCGCPCPDGATVEFLVEYDAPGPVNPDVFKGKLSHGTTKSPKGKSNGAAEEVDGDKTISLDFGNTDLGTANTGDVILNFDVKPFFSKGFNDDKCCVTAKCKFDGTAYIERFWDRGEAGEKTESGSTPVKESVNIGDCDVAAGQKPCCIVEYQWDYEDTFDFKFGFDLTARVKGKLTVRVMVWEVED